MTSCMATWVATFYSVVLVMTCSMEGMVQLTIQTMLMTALISLIEDHSSTVETEMMKSLPPTKVETKFLAAMVMT